jgi:hypothetical protein
MLAKEERLFVMGRVPRPKDGDTERCKGKMVWIEDGWLGAMMFYSCFCKMRVERNVGRWKNGKERKGKRKSALKDSFMVSKYCLSLSLLPILDDIQHTSKLFSKLHEILMHDEARFGQK